MDRDDARFAGFETEGEATVRDRVAGGRFSPYNEEHRSVAIRWLAKLDQAREAGALARKEASQAEQIKVARSAKNAAWAAAIAAIVAAVVAIVAAIIAYLAWASPHR